MKRTAVIVTLIGLVLAPSAGAAVEATQITTPTDPWAAFYDLTGGQGPFGIYVTGKATQVSGTGQKVDLRCYFDATTDKAALLSQVAVDNTTREFSAYLDASLLLRPCVLRAVPVSTLPPAIDAAKFTGPRMYPSAMTDARVRDLTSPNAGVLYDVYDHLTSPDRTTHLALGSLGYCGLYFAQPLDPAGDPSATARSVFNCAGFVDYTADGTPQSRSDIVIDARNAVTAGVQYGSKPSPDVAGPVDKIPGMPPLSASRIRAPATGDELLVETSLVRRCRDEPASYPPADATAGAACGEMVDTGVRYARTSQTSDNGRVVTVTDRWSSIDGQAHGLDLLLEQDMYSTAYGWQIPWVGPDFASYSGTTSIGPAPSAPQSILIRSDTGMAEGTQAPVGAITFSTAPDGVEFYDDGKPISRYPQLHYARTIPAAGELVIGHTYSFGTNFETVRALAARAEDRYAGPALTITAPAPDSTTATQKISVTGTVFDNGGVRQLTVFDTPISVGADGSWAAVTTLDPGLNTIPVAATDNQGNATQASVAVTYAVPGAPCLVPKLVGLTRTAARKALAKRNCRLGAARSTYVKPRRVRHGRKRFVVTIRKGRIVSQRVKTGSKIANGSAIAVKVQGSKPRKKSKKP